MSKAHNFRKEDILEKRRVRVFKPIYKDSIVLVSTIDDGVFKTMTITGKNLPVIKGRDLYVTGFMTQGKYGKQFKVEEFEEILPSTEKGILNYLASLKLPKLPKRKLKLIVKEYGEDTLKVLDEDFDRIAEINGIPKDLSRAKQRWAECFYRRAIEKYFKDINTTNSFKTRVAEHYKANLEQTITENTYDILKVRGATFEIVDALAKDFYKDYDEYCIPRIKAAIIEALMQGSNSGHVFLGFNFLQTAVCKILNVKVDIRRVVNQMVLNKELSFEKLNKDIAIYLYKDMRDEEKITKKLYLMQKAKIQGRVDDKIVDEIEEELGITLAAKQRDAVIGAVKSKVSIITGGPGRGKTTTINSVIKALKKQNSKVSIRLLAPTGKAARRMSEQTNMPAQTIHSALKIHNIPFSDIYDYEVANAHIDDDVIIVDECSMLGQGLFNILLSNIKESAKLILVGDVDQIPSVQSGNVFKELILSRCLATCVLDTPFRQAEESCILVNADKINTGFTNLKSGDDFIFHNIMNEDEIVKKVLDTYLEEVNKSSLDDVWLLTPFRKYGELGSNALNEKLRDVLNPLTNQKTLGYFRVGDKVMLMENMDGFSNGDTGYITDVLEADDEEPYDRVVVDFGFGEKDFTEPELIKLSLAYASTIHKSQGSECATIIMVEHKMFAGLNKRNLLYTGVTRAKKKVIMIGQMAAVKDSILDNSCVLRNTLIASRLRHYIPVKTNVENVQLELDLK